MMSIYEAQACSSCRTLAAVTEKLDRLRNPPPRKRGSRVRAATLVAIAAGLGSRR